MNLTPRCALHSVRSLRHFRKLEIDACVTIHFLRCVDVELIKRNVAMMLVANVEHSACHGVVADLLRRPSVLEDKRDDLLVGQRR